ncbi:hypothetical protein MMC10_004318 [Thelotrema lepadinum]|nr:hypothetical protein [Thelotrema lepadinum]
MSQRQATPVQANNGANGPSQLSPRKRPTLPPIKPYSSANEHLQHDHRGGSQSPVVHASPKDGPGGSATNPEPRSFKMHSILNPAGVNDETSSQRSSLPPDSYPHRSTSESPASSNGPLTPGKTFLHMSGLPSPHLAGHSRHGLHAQMTANRGPNGTSINVPTATIDAKKSPFLSHPGKGSYPPMDMIQGQATPPAIARQAYPFPQQTLIKSEDRRGSEASQLIPSQSNSPTTSLTSYGTGTGSRTSPVLSYSHCGVPTSEQLQTMNGGPPPPGANMGPNSAYGAPTNGTGQVTYQMMTIDTEKGPVQFPVDVQAASKVADEKRKRNAGASARFRQRRKEKEREASSTIARLENKVRDLSDEREFYRVERDYFRKLVYNSSAQSQVVPRPSSPRPRRTSIDTTSTGTPEWQQNGDRGSDDGRNQRRRISGFFEGGPGQPPPPPPQGPPPTSHNPHAKYPLQQPIYGYPPDPMMRGPPAPHERLPIPGQPPLPGPPQALRNAPYDGSHHPQAYDRGYYSPRG